MEKTSKFITILEKLLELIKKYSIVDFLKGFLLIIICACVVGIISNPSWIFDKYKEWSEEQHKEQIMKRTENNYKIQATIEKLMYKTNASRCVVISLHNGLNDINSIPYLRGSAIYECINTGVIPISDQYQNVMLSLFPFSNYLYLNDYWCGDLKELKEMDKSLYHRLAANETTHLCAFTIHGKDSPIGIIFLTYTYDVSHTCKDVKKEVQHASLELSLLMGK